MIYFDEIMFYVLVEWYDCLEGYIDICYEKFIDGIVKIIINCL